MRKILPLLLIVFFSNEIAAYAKADSISVLVSRQFSKQLFELNGIPYLKPMVESINATSNSRFFNTAFVPQKVKKPYFKFGIHLMTGFIGDDRKTYNPRIPLEELDINKLNQYATIDYVNQKINILDTAGLIYYMFQTLLNDAVKKNRIGVPQTAATILGSQKAEIKIPWGALDSTYKEQPYYQLLKKSNPVLADSISNMLYRFPGLFTLPPGANMNSMFVGIPQLEIGSILGTEMLIRFVPTINMGTNIGDFTFWGIGVKHSISQYFNSGDAEEERDFDLAIQAVYQGTMLKNKVGVTNSDLKSKATFFNINIQASKSFKDIIDVYTGFSFESVKISSDFTYVLPIETQQQLGLLEKVKDSTGREYILPPDPSRGFPGDTQPQSSHLDISDTNFKWVIGVAKHIGPVNIFLYYNVSKFNIFTGGIEVRF